MNSTFIRFFVEFTCRQLTGSQAIADIDVIVVQSLLIVNPKKIEKKIKNKLIHKFKKLTKTKSRSVFKEISYTPEGVALDKIKNEIL